MTRIIKDSRGLFAGRIVERGDRQYAYDRRGILAGWTDARGRLFNRRGLFAGRCASPDCLVFDPDAGR